LCRRRRAGQYWSAAAARRRSKKVIGGAARRWRKKLFKDSRKNFVLFPKFSDDFFLVIDRKLQQNKYIATTKPSGARRQIIGGLRR